MFVKKRMLGVFIGLVAALITVSAFVKVPIQPIPFTLQMFIVFLAPMVFGSFISFFGFLLYVALGLAGLPIFASGGGIGYVLVPSFGFMVGYVISAIPAGFIAKIKPNIYGYFLAGFVALVIIYFCGVLGLYLNINFIQGREMSLLTAIKVGALPFIPFDIIKLAVAIAITPSLKGILLYSSKK